MQNRVKKCLKVSKMPDFIVSVLLSASVERVSVSRMRDFFCMCDQTKRDIICHKAAAKKKVGFIFLWFDFSFLATAGIPWCLTILVFRVWCKCRA